MDSPPLVNMSLAICSRMVGGMQKVPTLHMHSMCKSCMHVHICCITIIMDDKCMEHVRKLRLSVLYTV